MDKPLRVAVYCRVGNPDQLALNMQKHSVCKYAVDKGYSVEAVVTEQTSGARMERDGLRRITDMAQSGEIDAVVTMSCSRLGRNMVDLLNYTKVLQRENVAVNFMKEGIMSPRLVDILGAVTE